MGLSFPRMDVLSMLLQENLFLLGNMIRPLAGTLLVREHLSTEWPEAIMFLGPYFSRG